MKIKKIAVLIVIILLLIGLFSNCYAKPIDVTKENLNASLQKFASSDSNENNYKITVSDDVITIAIDGQNYKLNYDLTEKPTFSLETYVRQGMSYAEFKGQELMLPMIGYLAVANIQGVEFDNAAIYFALSYIESIGGVSFDSSKDYWIFDDTNLEDGVTIEKDDSDTKTIYASDFGRRAMEYVNAVYKDQTIKDSAEGGINSYEWTTQKKDVTETSCKLVTSLSINLDADFSKLNEYEDKTHVDNLNKDITKENADYTITLKVGQKCRVIPPEGTSVGWEAHGTWR